MMKPSTFWMLALAPALFIADLPAERPAGGVSLIKEAHAVVGRPLTPVSAAGVARRTTRRAIVATSVYVATLPPACTVVVIEGTTLHQCGTTYYQASGTQYVVVKVE
jgi:hypothetical protein